LLKEREVLGKGVREGGKKRECARDPKQDQNKNSIEGMSLHQQRRKGRPIGSTVEGGHERVGKPVKGGRYCRIWRGNRLVLQGFTTTFERKMKGTKTGLIEIR